MAIVDFEAGDFGWFSPVDLNQLFRALASLSNPQSVVLVGGQALSFWVDYFHIPVPETGTPYLTQDADFLAMKTDAEELNHLLGGKLKVATLSDNTPNTAIIEFVGPSGNKLIIDFLGIVAGLNPDEVRRLSVPVEIEGNRINVLHPMLCLKSRMFNLYSIPSKRNRNGVAQAKVSIEVAKRYLDNAIATGRIRDALKWASYVAKIGYGRDGLMVWERYEIDVTQAIEPTKFPVPLFQEMNWPAQLKKIDGKRKVVEAKKKRQQDLEFKKRSLVKPPTL